MTTTPLTRSHAFATPPTAMQLARDGDWEQSQRWEASRWPEESEITATTAGRTELAFELFFGSAFFGVRFFGAPEQLAAHIRACVQSAVSARDLANFLAALSKATDLHGWGTAIDFAEVGAVNAWKSSGAVRAPQLPATDAAFSAWWEEIVAAPLARDTVHPKAIEFVSVSPVSHWLALPVSASRAPFALDRERLRRAVLAASSGPG